MAAGTRGRRGAGPWTQQATSGIAAINRFQELAMDDDDVEDAEEEEQADDEEQHKIPGDTNIESSGKLQEPLSGIARQQGLTGEPRLAQASSSASQPTSSGTGPQTQRQQRKERGARSQRETKLMSAWHEDEYSSDFDSDDNDGDNSEGEHASAAPSGPTPARATAATLFQPESAAAIVEDNVPLAYDSASSAASSSDNLASLPPELRAHTASLLAQAQAADGLSPTAELIFDTAIWTIPLVFVFVLLDVLVRQQYSQPVWVSGEVKRVLSRGPFIGGLSYYSLKHRSSSWIRYGFFGLSLGTGAGFLYVTAKSDYEAVLRQTPALGALWVMSIIKLDLVPAVVSLALVGAFVKVLDLDLFQ